jgi:hypothetical protein
MANTSVTAEDLLQWLTPRQALGVVQESFPDIGIASRAIFEGLSGGIVKAAARSSSSNANSNMPTAPCLIPAEYWSHLHETRSDWWDTGTIKVQFWRSRPSRSFYEVIRCFGVRFHPLGIQYLIADTPKILPPNPEAQPAPSPSLDADVSTPVDPPAKTQAVPKRHPGGRPAKEYWDHLWAAMAMAVYSGDLQPQRQADIERAMADWLSANGHDAGEATIRRAAKALWVVWSAQEDQN